MPVLPVHKNIAAVGNAQGLGQAGQRQIETSPLERVWSRAGRLLGLAEVLAWYTSVGVDAADYSGVEAVELIGRINMDYPTLKIFLDVVDDATPQLVVAGNLMTSAGISEDQFAEFTVNVLDGTRLLADECLQLDYLFAEADRPRSGGSQALH